jgi:hypothetical protein
MSFTFDATHVEPDQGRVGSLPAGWYSVAIDKSELKPGNNPGTERLNLQFNIVDGAYKGNKFFHGLNVKNPSEKAVEISFKQLSAIMHAIGVLKINESPSELHGRPLKVKVKVVPAEMDTDGTVKYEAKNEISAFRNINDPSAVNPSGAAVGGVTPAKIAAPIAPLAQVQPWAQNVQPAAQPAPIVQPAPVQAAPAAAMPVQPWGQPVAAQPAPAVVLTAPQATAAAPVWGQPDPNAQPAPATVAPVQTATAAPSPAVAPAPTNPVGQEPAPWLVAPPVTA